MSPSPTPIGLTIEGLDDGLRLTGAQDPLTGCIRSIEVRLDPVLPSMTVLHRLHNGGARPARAGDLAHHPAAPRRLALLPQRRAAAGHATRPNRNLVLWPYSSWDDPRLHVLDGLVAVDGVPGTELKVGCLDDTGWVAFVRDGIAIVRRFEPEPGEAAPRSRLQRRGHYCGSSLPRARGPRPIRTLPPGAATTLLEQLGSPAAPGRRRAIQARERTRARLPIDGLAA